MVRSALISIIEHWLTIFRYHGKCLKIARGKVKEDDGYTCPVCDWRTRIPRDAARPKLEELQDWHAELETLPFQPEEEDTLVGIIDTAQAFRDYIRPFCNQVGLSSDEITTLRFYLRKVEGADILLAFETNFLRQELHKWVPIAPQPPPVIQSSGSTRKPRPTKQQKLMASLGITNPDDLPPQYKMKLQKRKASETSLSKPARLEPAAPSPGSTHNTSVMQNSTPTPHMRPGLHQQHSGHSTPAFSYPPSGPTPSGPIVSTPYRDSPLFAHSSSFTAHSTPQPVQPHGPLSRPTPSFEQSTPRFEPATVNPAQFSHDPHAFPQHTSPPPPPSFGASSLNLDPALFGSSNGGLIFDKRSGSVENSPTFVHDQGNVNFGSSTNSNQLDSMFADMVHNDDDHVTLGQEDEDGHAGEAFAASGQEEAHDDARLEEFVNHS